MKSPSGFGRQPNVSVCEALRKSSQGAKRYLTMGMCIHYSMVEETREVRTEKTPLPMRGEAEGETDYLFFVSGVRCQILSLYSLMVRSEENTPLLATLMISLRVHAFLSR